MVRRQDGMALVTVLILIFVFSLLAWAFVARMHGEQRLVGSASRGTAALYLAEAGAEKALRLLSSTTSGGLEHDRPLVEGYQEEMGSGRFVIEKTVEDPPGTIAVTVRGEAGDSVRRIRVIARMVPKALGLGLYGGNTVALARGARVYVVPSTPAKKAEERMGDVAVARELWVEEDAALNDLDERALTLREGRVKDHALFGLSSSIGADLRMREILPDLVATGTTDLVSVTKTRVIYDHDTLRREHPRVHVRALKREEVSLPSADLEALRTLARSNVANADINRAVGERFFDRTLRDKANSQYTSAEFERILTYLDMKHRDTGREHRLGGVVYVEGLVNIGRALHIDDGVLVVRGKIHVGDGARLEIRHGPQSRHLPGLVAATDGGMIRVGHEAVMIVDGVVFASSGLHVSRATMDVSGAIIAGQGVLVEGGLVVVRYQPDVLGTIGLTRTHHVLVRPVAWQEIH